MKKALDYIPGIVAFLAVGMGVSTAAKWNPSQPGLHHLTKFGWATVGLGAAALVASFLLTWHRQKDLDFQSRQRKRIQAIAHAEARLAIAPVTGPFFSLFGDDTEESEMLVPPHIEDPDRLAAVMRVDARSKSNFDSGFGSEPWFRVLKEAADRGAARIDRAMQIYAAYFEPEVLEELSRLRTSEFLVLRLQGLETHVEVNKRLAFLEFPFVNAPDMSDCWGFGEFWNTVRTLDALLMKEPDRLRRRL